MSSKGPEQEQTCQRRGTGGADGQGEAEGHAFGPTPVTEQV